MTEDSSGRLRRRAETILNGGNFEAADITATSLKEVLHELYVHQAELEIQNEELRGAQQALEASRLQYLQLFQSVPLACLAINAAGIVGEANAAAERQFGLPMLRLKGRPLTLLVDSVDHGRLFTAMGRLRESGQWMRQEFRFVGPQGAIIDGLTDARRVSLDDGERGDVLLTITDVTERNAWIREVQRARDDAERARADYHHILQSVGDGIMGVDADGRIRFVNTAATALTGFIDLDLVGRPPSDLLAGPAADDGSHAPDRDGGAAHALALALTDGRSRTIACERLRQRDGSIRLVEVTVSPMIDRGASSDRIGARIQGAVVAFRDVTARRAAEAALNLSERRHRVLVQSMHDALVMTSANGQVLVANTMAERLMAGPAGRLLDPAAAAFGDGGAQPVSSAARRIIDADGTRLQGLPPAAEAVRCGRPVVERIVGVTDGEEAADGAPGQSADRAERKAGGSPTRWLRVSSHPVTDAAGRVEAVVSSAADITAIKALERELNVALDARERFLAAASHDLRQPVQALMLLTNLMVGQALPDDARRLAQQIQTSVGALGGMLDGMLDISKLEAGLVTPQEATVDVAPLLLRLHGELAPVAASAGQRLRVVAPPLTLRTDPTLLERALRNLLTNALRYAPGGRILLGARRRGDRLRIEVWDTGIGIADQHIDRVFQDFFQVGNAARDRREGLGLGLSIARRLVTMLGGTIDAVSTLGRGTRFAISLPLAGADAPPAGAPDVAWDGAPDDGTSRPQDDAASRADRLVLLVEDDAVIRMSLALMLEEWGYRVVEAGSGTEVNALLDTGEAPDLILADYRLPEGSTGLMVMDMVRRRLDRDIPGVLLTGDTSADRLREAAGAQCALLHKPVQPARLHDALLSALDGPGDRPGDSRKSGSGTGQVSVTG